MPCTFLTINILFKFGYNFKSFSSFTDNNNNNVIGCILCFIPSISEFKRIIIH